MTTLFDDYGSEYGRVVDDSVNFSGLKHDFFLKAKADLLFRIAQERNLDKSTETPRTLDVGCGIGALHPYLGKFLPRLEGCDISAASIERARSDNPSVEYQAYSASTLPYSSSSFDLAFAVCVMHHVEPRGWLEFVSEMKRVVRPGGCVTIIEHNPLNPLTRLAVLRCPFDKDAVLLNHRKTARLLADCGLQKLRSEHFLLFPTKARIAQSVERAFSRLPIGAQYAVSAIV